MISGMVSILRGNLGTEYENGFLNQAGMVGLSCKYFSSQVRWASRKDQEITALETFCVLGER